MASAGWLAAGAQMSKTGERADVPALYAMNQGRGGWQHKHVRHFVDLAYAAL